VFHTYVYENKSRFGKVKQNAKIYSPI